MNSRRILNVIFLLENFKLQIRIVSGFKWCVGEEKEEEEEKQEEEKEKWWLEGGNFPTSPQRETRVMKNAQSGHVSHD